MTSAPLLDRAAVWRAVVVTLVLGVPPVVVVRVLKSGDLAGKESNLWALAVGLVLVAFAVGGWVAARRGPDLPLSHSAGAAALAYGTMVVGSAVAAAFLGNRITAALVLAVAMLGAVCVSLAVIGGYAAVWWDARKG